MKRENNTKKGNSICGENKDEVVLHASLDGTNYPIIIGFNLKGIADKIASFTESKRVFILCDSFFKGKYCSRFENDLAESGFEFITFFIQLF